MKKRVEQGGDKKRGRRRNLRV